MRFASLGSGSEGNALLVEAEVDTRIVRVLIDCGFGVRTAWARLEQLGVNPASLDAILVTHEHGDHIGGVAALARRAAVPVFGTRGTLQTLIKHGTQAGVTKTAVRQIFIDPDQIFEIRGLRIEPVAVPHDAREPVQFVLDDGHQRLGVLTDLGHGSAHVQRRFDRLDALILEANHDSELLQNGPYPAALKRRIAGPWGHLSNEAAGALLARIDQSRLRLVVAAHLSRHNNRADLARAALARAWGGDPEAIRIADQDQGCAWTTI